MRQNEGKHSGCDSIPQGFTSIFSTTPIVQLAQDHDFMKIFSSTLVVQPIDFASKPFQFQRCTFIDVNLDWSQSDFEKSIFKGKAIVQPTKPFFINPRFHDHQSGWKSQALDVVDTKIWAKSPYFEEGESSYQNQCPQSLENFE